MSTDSANELVLYSCLFGRHDDVEQTLGMHVSLPGVHRVLYTDASQLDLPGWEVRPPAYWINGERRSSRWHKTHPHRLFPAAKQVVWCDASLVIYNDDFLRLLEDLRKTEPFLAAWPHEVNRCVYDEAAFILSLDKAHPDMVREQVSRYRMAGLPPRMGAISSGVLICSNPRQHAEFFELWWDEIAGGCDRDQLSFPYAIWRTQKQFTPLPGNIYSNGWLRHKPHQRK